MWRRYAHSQPQWEWQPQSQQVTENGHRSANCQALQIDCRSLDASSVESSSAHGRSQTSLNHHPPGRVASFPSPPSLLLGALGGVVLKQIVFISSRFPLCYYHPPFEMASSSHGDPQALPPAVNLHCLQCDAQIGAFDNNEWIRLTSSYVRSARPGTHLATEVAKRTQVVPDGVPHRAVEGCTLAEVFCMNCSATVGQYCISAPTPAQRHLV